jgi:hypothetical protein
MCCPSGTECRPTETEYLCFATAKAGLKRRGNGTLEEKKVGGGRAPVVVVPPTHRSEGNRVLPLGGRFWQAKAGLKGRVNETSGVELEQKVSVPAAAGAIAGAGAAAGSRSGKKGGGAAVKAGAWHVVVPVLLAVLVHVLI